MLRFMFYEDHFSDSVEDGLEKGRLMVGGIFKKLMSSVNSP